MVRNALGGSVGWPPPVRRSRRRKPRECMSEFLRQRSTGSIWYGAVGMTQRKVKWLGVAPQQQAKSRSRLAVGSQIAGFLAEALATHPEGSLGLVEESGCARFGSWHLRDADLRGTHQPSCRLFRYLSHSAPSPCGGLFRAFHRNDHHFGSADTPENGLDRTSRLSER